MDIKEEICGSRGHDTQPNGRTDSRNSNAIVELFSELPPEAFWLRTGLVERQVSSTVWQTRKMILTAAEVLLIKAGSDTIVERMPIRSVVFAGHAKPELNTDQESTPSGWRSESTKSLDRGGSFGGLPLPAGDSATHFAFELRLASAAGADRRGRSCLARVGTAAERDAWLAAILAAVRVFASLCRA
jgi:hypothetical protein